MGIESEANIILVQNSISLGVKTMLVSTHNMCLMIKPEYSECAIVSLLQYCVYFINN